MLPKPSTPSCPSEQDLHERDSVASFTSHSGPNCARSPDRYRLNAPARTITSARTVRAVPITSARTGPSVGIPRSSNGFSPVPAGVFGRWWLGRVAMGKASYTACRSRPGPECSGRASIRGEAETTWASRLRGEAQTRLRPHYSPTLLDGDATLIGTGVIEPPAKQLPTVAASATSVLDPIISTTRPRRCILPRRSTLRVEMRGCRLRAQCYCASAIQRSGVWLLVKPSPFPQRAAISLSIPALS